MRASMAGIRQWVVALRVMVGVVMAEFLLFFPGFPAPSVAGAGGMPVWTVGLSLGSSGMGLVGLALWVAWADIYNFSDWTWVTF